ncbi:methyl-accepting chemotaxis protein [Aquabacterium sp.]|jgi:methyl-accepting chemotaxis protein|uniref:methyl-accepting chemotaxis protein n=1 Tax=Aquabacterium sp. TaxID=1872578 RepID=UPI0026365FF4|nr:methyl-accepting chemotaxis protein [Aquabacterium sp.]MDD2977955.1 methyl-accepting chemotaxis protein [Aquabacterium sp.]
MNLITWLRRFSIRSRLITCMVLVVGIGSIVGSGMSWQLWSLKGEFDAFTQQEFAAVQRMGKLALNLSALRGHEKAAIINAGDSVSAQAEFKAWQAALTATDQATQALQEAAPSEAIAAQIQALRPKLASYGQALTPTLQMVTDLSITSSAEAYQGSESARAEADAIERQVNTLNDSITELAEARRIKAADGVVHTIALLWGLLLSPGFIFLPLMALTILSITRPLRRAEDITQAIAHGDLTHDIEPRGHDEITHLMVSMKQMQDGLREMVASVRESSESMLTASTQIAAGNQDLSSRTEQTASNLQSTSSAMDELSKTVENSADSAHVANELSSAASQRAVAGGEVVESVVTQMADISQASRQIGDIIGVIDGIAFQTNILALNAAVEAARAGEQGRGFAVVAGEVRSLAQRSAEAAREIKGLIGKSTERVEMGSQKVREAGAVMTEIVDAIQRVTHAMGEIAEATRQQSMGIGHVSLSINQLDQMTQQNAALVEESAAAADSLRQQAIELSRTVQRFHIEVSANAAIQA